MMSEIRRTFLNNKVSFLPDHQYFRSLEWGKGPSGYDCRKDSKCKLSIIIMYLKPWISLSPCRIVIMEKQKILEERGLGIGLHIG